MPQIKVEKKDKFTQIDNNLIRNQNLSLKAKGLLIYMLSLPDDWDYSISGLSATCKEGKSSIRSAIDELITQRYITRSLARGKNGLLDGYEYVAYETPQPSCDYPTTDNRSPDHPSSDDPASENRTQQIKDLTNKDNTNTPYSPPAGDAPANDIKPKDKPKSRTRRTRKKASVPTYAPERFEQFWQAYPGGGSRLKAVEAWDALAPDDALIDEMARALKRQIATRQWREGIGIPHACRWLSDRRWTDKLPETPSPPQSSSTGWTEDP